MDPTVPNPSSTTTWISALTPSVCGSADYKLSTPEHHRGFLMPSTIYFAVMKTGKYPEDFAARWEAVMQSLPSMKPYPEQYLKYLFDKRFYYLRIYMVVLDEVIQRTGKTPSQITLIDYGCGNGILGLLACFTGFKKVFFQDTDKDFFEAARALSNAMQLKNVEFIPGDINSLLVKEVKADAL